MTTFKTTTKTERFSGFTAVAAVFTMFASLPLGSRELLCVGLALAVVSLVTMLYGNWRLGREVTAASNSFWLRQVEQERTDSETHLSLAVYRDGLVKRAKHDRKVRIGLERKTVDHTIN